MDTTQDLDEIFIKQLNLSQRTTHALNRAGVFTVGKLKKLWQGKKLTQFFNIGPKSLDEISTALCNLYKNTSEHDLYQNASEYAKTEIKIDDSMDSSELDEVSIKQLNSSPRTFHHGHVLTVGESNNFISSFTGIIREDINNVSIGILDLSIAIKRSLNKNGIKTVGDLSKMSYSDILDINRIGPKALEEIRQALVAIYSNPDKYRIQQKFEFGDGKTRLNQTQICEGDKRKVNWSEIVQSYFESEKDVYRFILLSRYGVKPKTLEEIAGKLGVTRERVRQIQEAAAIRFLKYMRLAIDSKELLSKVNGILSFYGEDLSLKKFREVLRKEKILGEFSSSFVSERISKIDPFEALICWLNLLSNSKYSLKPMLFPVDINALIYSKNVSINDLEILENISSKTRKKIRRKVYFTGGINIKDAVTILSADERTAALVLDGLNLRKLQNSWYSLKTYDAGVDGEKIPIRVAGLKILAVAPEVELPTFCDGLRRHVNRFYSSIAPNEVIIHTLQVLGFDVNIDGQVSTKLSLSNVFSRSEKCLISIMSKKEGVASFLEIVEEFFLHNLSLPAVSVTLKRSPIVEKIDEGFYKLRGTKISWQQVETAKGRQKNFSQGEEIVHGLDGIVRVRLTVNSYAYLSGVVGSYNIKGLSGSWPVVRDNEFFGDAKLDESYLWGLSKIFKKLDVQLGDRIELAFNAWNKTLCVEKVEYGNT